MGFTEQDTIYMRHAMVLAESAAFHGEVPVGAVLVREGKIIGEGFNKPITQHDPSAHAEIVALRQGAQKIQNYRLLNTTLYVTLEPCIMCVGAMVHARIKRVVYGAFDPKTGAVASVFKLGEEGRRFNHKIEFAGGLLADECGEILKRFFKDRR